jgi:FtsH-binding integral membrane protein
MAAGSVQRTVEDPMENFERAPATAFGGRGIATAERATAFLRAVYGWMCAGLAITALVAYSIAGSPVLVQALVTNHLLFLGLFVAQIALVFFLSARVDSLAPGIATLLFIAYAALTGVTLSVLVLAYTGASIATTFVVTAGMFGALALYGSTTSRSLAGVGQFFFMGLIGLVLASIVGIFWQSAALQFLISVVGVIVFTGLTAWDAQRLKQMAPRPARGAARLLCHRGHAIPLSRLHQPLPLPPAPPRRSARVVGGRPGGPGQYSAKRLRRKSRARRTRDLTVPGLTCSVSAISGFESPSTSCRRKGVR